jgi:hypothetical protein
MLNYALGAVTVLVRRQKLRPVTVKRKHHHICSKPIGAMKLLPCNCRLIALPIGRSMPSNAKFFQLARKV